MEVPDLPALKKDIARKLQTYGYAVVAGGPLRRKVDPSMTIAQAADRLVEGLPWKVASVDGISEQVRIELETP